ncbi:NUDIX hydrolase [Pseudomonas sp. OV226]|uniref:NUDIX hydrolase n=1 Tax=Pseudomonas sp. OV226 TaxID=2135588 RepID=UPI000D6D9140|nr:NUDIX hydrolase [Pseudomonas sp. OV226]
MKVKATVICERDKHILLVRKSKSKWALPGGKVEAGEAIVGAAARELQEETGLSSEQLLYIFEFDAGKTHHHVFEASVLDNTTATPKNEITECIWHPLSGLHDLDASDSTKSIARFFNRRL